MSAPSIDEKLEEVLKLIVRPNYKISSCTNLDLLLSQIAEKSSKPDLLTAKHIAIYRKWLLEASQVWSEGTKPCQPVAVFTLQLVGVIGREEERFQRLREDDILDKLCRVLDLLKDELEASVKMAFAIMLTDFVDHVSGRAWIRETGIWKDIVKFAHHNHTLYVTRQSHRFLSSLLIHESQNEEYCAEMILYIADPLIKTTFNSEANPSLEDLYTHQNKHLCNSLKIITSIYEETLFLSLDNTIPNMFEIHTNLESRVKALFEACISTRFAQHVQKLWILLSVRILKEGLTANPDVLDKKMFERFREGLSFAHTLLLSKKLIIELTHSHKMTLIYWTKLRAMHKFTVEIEHRFEDQIITLLITPLCTCIRTNYTKEHEYFEMFLDKIFDVTCHNVQRIIYTTKSVVCSSNDLPLEQICKTIIDVLMELKDVLHRDLAIIPFQMMCHVLKNYITEKCPYSPESEPPTPHTTKIRPRKKSILDGDPIVDVPILLSTLLNGVGVMAEKFKFKWKECVETTCVLFIAEGILKHPGVDPKICVQALRLCKLAIQDFMPPHLALLIDCDNHMSGIAMVLFKRLHDPNWEVRDSVFETLTTIATISGGKYPAFQDFLLENKFLQTATDIAMTDGESYVRASALVFISASIRVHKLWSEQLSQLNLAEKAIRLLKNESEGIVRREAVMLISELYVFRKWPKAIIDTMHRSMVDAAIVDLHWEVKVNALQYWQHVITMHFANQGVLDGEFPNVTFSREHRRIITLNEPEIKRRCSKVLDELAQLNCLSVLLATLEDESDFEVSRKSAEVIVKLKNFLLKYKVNQPQAPSPSAKDSAVMDTTYVRTSPPRSNEESGTRREKSSSVIDEIVNATDANLLASFSKDTTNVDDENTQVKPETPNYISRITKENFLAFVVSRDINAYIEERKRWLNTYTTSLESILEDILSYQTENVNSMDCY